MLLEKKAIAGRAFLMQYGEIVSEFGELIPWLRDAASLKFVTNGRAFDQKLHACVGCPQGSIVPYQLLSSDRSRELVGAMLHFTIAPESFKDRTNRDIQAVLEREGASYVTCLQVRHAKRGSGHGADLVRRVISRILM